MARKQISRKHRVKKNIENGVTHIRSTFNNTIVTITGEFDNALPWSSAGVLGFKGSKKSTPFVAQMVSKTAPKSAMEHGLKTVEVTIKGPSPDRESAIHALQSAGLEVATIRDVTPVPHNGYRPPRCHRI